MSNKVIDDFTFGDSKAEITLAKLLTKRNNPGLTRFVTKFLVSYTEHLKAIKLEPDYSGTRTFLFDVLKRHAVDTIDNCWLAKQEPEVTTYFKNCLIKRLRKFARNEL